MNVEDYIPQRRPFLFIDHIIDYTDSSVIAETVFRKECDFFQGHFPQDPIVPGALLSEACFQSGAALVGLKNTSRPQVESLAVVSRIQSAKFKQIVRPNEKLTIKTTLTEEVSNAAYFKSIITNEKQQKVLLIDFACTLVEK